MPPIRKLNFQDFEELHRSFQKAFQNYGVQMSNEITDFERRLRRIGADYGFSAGVFEGQEMLAFVIHALGVWDEKKTVYNGGTGVIPAYRGQKLIHRIYDFLTPILQENQIEQVILEVLCNNFRAIRLYQDLGFRTQRKLKSYLQHSRKKYDLESPFLQTISFQTIRNPDWQQYQIFQRVRPSWQNSFQAIRNNWEHETIIEAYQAEKLLAFMSVDRASGRISHLNVLPAYRGLGIGSYMLAAAYALFPATKLAMINLDEDAQNFHNFLLKNGFSVEVEQYEMLLKL